MEKSDIARLAEESIRTGDLDAAWQLLMSHKSMIWDDPDLLSMLAVIQIAKGNYQAAERFLLEVLGVFPFHSDLLFNLAFLYELKGNRSAAHRLYKIVRQLHEEQVPPDVEEAISRMSIPASAKPRIALVYNSHSGSNTLALYKLIPNDLREHYDVRLVKQTSGFEFQVEMLDSDLVVTTHGQTRLFPIQPNLELWHGFPLKALGLMDKQENHAALQSHWMKHTDVIASYSPLFSVLMNATNGKSISNYVVTGAPRNDFLFKSNGRELLSRVLQRSLVDRKIVFFMPTFRNRSSLMSDGAPPLENFEVLGLWDDEFSELVDRHRITLVLKVHPHEEHQVLSAIASRGLGGHACVLRESDLQEHGIDLYEVLNAVDVLVTDYSSVYFDFLLLDRPMVFTQPDVDEYRSRRGFLLEPVEQWTPGPHVVNASQFRVELERCLQQPQYYQAERKYVSRMVHQYIDGNSTLRVWNVIQSMLAGRHQ